MKVLFNNTSLAWWLSSPFRRGNTHPVKWVSSSLTLMQVRVTGKYIFLSIYPKSQLKPLPFPLIFCTHLLVIPLILACWETNFIHTDAQIFIRWMNDEKPSLGSANVAYNETNKTSDSGLKIFNSALSALNSRVLHQERHMWNRGNSMRLRGIRICLFDYNKKIKLFIKCLLRDCWL